VITTDVAGTASAVYVRGDDEHIYYSAYSPGGMATWIAVSGADGAAVASTSDLDCASDGASGTVQLVALGAMPLGDVLHASGTGSSFSPFVDLGFSTSQGPSVMGNGGPGLALISPVSGGTPSSTITYRTYDSSWAAVSQTQSAPSLTKAFTSGVDADIVGNGFGTVGFVAFADDGTMAEVLLTNYMGTSWGASYFSPPTGSTFQYSPSMCIAHAGTTYESQLVFVVTAGSRLWYSHGSSSGFSTWQKISDVAVASAPDCVINSYSASGAVQINVVALTETGSVLHVHGPWAGTFSSVDLGVYP
jgi:hypothetical protein